MWLHSECIIPSFIVKRPAAAALLSADHNASRSISLCFLRGGTNLIDSEKTVLGGSGARDAGEDKLPGG